MKPRSVSIRDFVREAGGNWRLVDPHPNAHVVAVDARRDFIGTAAALLALGRSRGLGPGVASHRRRTGVTFVKGTNPRLTITGDATEGVFNAENRRFRVVGEPVGIVAREHPLRHHLGAVARISQRGQLGRVGLGVVGLGVRVWTAAAGRRAAARRGAGATGAARNRSGRRCDGHPAETTAGRRGRGRRDEPPEAPARAVVVEPSPLGLLDHTGGEDAAYDAAPQENPKRRPPKRRPPKRRTRWRRSRRRVRRDGAGPTRFRARGHVREDYTVPATAR